MMRAVHKQTLLLATLAMLALRVLTPEGYMPGSAGSGLLFELCPAGMPAEVMRALGGGGHHHHHHDDKSPAKGTEQCPIGHMLSAAAATDSQSPAALAPRNPVFEAPSFTPPVPIVTVAYRSRAPPA